MIQIQNQKEGINNIQTQPQETFQNIKFISFLTVFPEDYENIIKLI